MSSESPIDAQLVALIALATSSHLTVPHLGLSLDVCEFISVHKKNTPYVAARELVRTITSHDIRRALLACELLEMCVVNCGYAVQFQVSRREWLNELVRRFPDRPPTLLSPVQQRTLRMLQTWRVVLCRESRYRDDMGYIEDLCRLLSYKGYYMPSIRGGASSEASGTAVANSGDYGVLKTAEELETEDNEANAAKLQELIRRGTAADLRKANDLMKVMVGYPNGNCMSDGGAQSRVREYEKEVESSLDRIRADALKLNEVLNAARPGEKIADIQSAEDLLGKCVSAQRRLQRMVQENEDIESLDLLLSLNDLIGEVRQKAKMIDNGSFFAARQADDEVNTQSEGDNNIDEVVLIDLTDFNSGGTNDETSWDPIGAEKDIAAGSSDDNAQGQSDLDLLASLDLSAQPSSTAMIQADDAKIMSQSPTFSILQPIVVISGQGRKMGVAEPKKDGAVHAAIAPVEPESPFAVLELAARKNLNA